MRRKLLVPAVCLLSMLSGFAGASVYSLVKSPPPTTHSPGSSYFSDVSASSPHNQDIGYLRECGVVQGYSDGAYHPGDAVTREQMATYVARALAFGAGGGELLVDYDYLDGWYFGNHAYQSGWITASEYNTFGSMYLWLVDMIWAHLEPLGYPNVYKGAVSTAPPSPDVLRMMAEVKDRIQKEHPEAAMPPLHR